MWKNTWFCFSCLFMHWTDMRMELKTTPLVHKCTCEIVLYVYRGIFISALLCCMYFSFLFFVVSGWFSSCVWIVWLNVECEDELLCDICWSFVLLVLCNWMAKHCLLLGLKTKGMFYCLCSIWNGATTISIGCQQQQQQQ